MSDSASLILSLLSSIRHEWAFAEVLIDKIESWDVTDTDKVSLVDLIRESFDRVQESEVMVKIENILFQISLIHLEEWEVRKWEIDEAQRCIQSEL